MVRVVVKGYSLKHCFDYVNFFVGTHAQIHQSTLIYYDAFNYDVC